MGTGAAVTTPTFRCRQNEHALLARRFALLKFSAAGESMSNGREV